MDNLNFQLEVNNPINNKPFVDSNAWNAWWELFVIIIAVIAIFVIVLKIIRKYFQRYHVVPPDWEPVIYRLQVPRIINKDKPEDGVQSVQELISKSENLFSTLGGMRAQRGFKNWFYGRTDLFSFEIVVQNGLIQFYASAPKKYERFLVEQLESVYPHISIDHVEDYNIFQTNYAVASAVMRQSREYIFPIKSFRKMENDPIGVLTNSLSQFQPAEGAVIQYVVRSAKKKWHKMGTKVASTMAQGKKLDEALRRAALFGSKFSFISSFISIILETVTSSKKQQNDPTSDIKKTYQLSQSEQDMIKGIEEKTAKAGFDVNIRIITSAVTDIDAENRLSNIINSFSQYNIYQYGNSLKPAIITKGKKKDRVVYDYIYRNFSESLRLILNTEELVSLWHMPLASNQTPNIDWMKAKQSAPPTNLPSEGLVVGISNYRGIKKEVRIKKSDRRRHMYIVGQTGTGKSTIMKNMMIQDIRNGEGCCVIDPHGDFAIDMLKNIPKERAEDVIYFNPADTERPVSINMLEYSTPEQKTFVVNELLSIFDKLYDLKATGGPMFEQYMRNALLLIMDDPETGMTLMEVPRVLADEEFRKLKLSRCKNLPIKEFWEKEAQKAGGEAALANMVPYITSKLTPFIANDVMRPIIAQETSSLNFRKIMDEGKILLVNLSKGKLGDINSKLLGMIIVGKILMASLSRVDMDEDQRKDYYLYIDEFQNFTTDSIAIILSEARKYRLNLTIAHQYINQLVKNNDTSIRDAVFGNVGTVVSYRVGVDDSEILAKQFSPVFDVYDVMNVPKYTAYIKLLIDNANPPAFNISIPPCPEGNAKIKDALIELSRYKYGRDKRKIDFEINEKLSKVNKLTKE